MNPIRKSFYRALHITQLSSHTCPKCGQPINRIHRKWYEKVMSLFITKMQRFACSSPDCDWEGRVVFTK